MHRTKHGFTLVELLVVITIIGMLIALLIPAVNMLRERGRVTSCLNNQHQLAVAILNYESGKRRLPGLMNQIPGGMQYTWVEALFPNLERNDLWNEISSNSGVLSLSSTASPTFRVAITICPDDQAVIDPTSLNAQALLSYAVNDQFFHGRSPAPPRGPQQCPGFSRGPFQPQDAAEFCQYQRPTQPPWLDGDDLADADARRFPDAQYDDERVCRQFLDDVADQFGGDQRPGKLVHAGLCVAFTPTPISPAPGTTSPGIMMSGHGSTMLKNNLSRHRDSGSRDRGGHHLLRWPRPGSDAATRRSRCSSLARRALAERLDFQPHEFRDHFGDCGRRSGSLASMRCDQVGRAGRHVRRNRPQVRRRRLLCATASCCPVSPSKGNRPASN